MLPNVVVGGGIVGLAVAKALQELDPARSTVLVEKEAGLAQHQSGHNSGVIHSGLYYTPGSLKAALVLQGARDLVAFCSEHQIPFDVSGKLVVATRKQDIGKLDHLLARGLQNSVPVRRADPDEVAHREPALRVLGALVVESTGRVDYRKVAAALAQEVLARQGTIRCGEPVLSVTTVSGEVRVRTSRAVIAAHRVAVCAGLHSDRLARASGIDPGVRILPFRGEYSELVPERAELVRGLIYPVPNPDLPFLGVHLTRGLDGVVHAGPNAVPALAREGYSWRVFSARDMTSPICRFVSPSAVSASTLRTGKDASTSQPRNQVTTSPSATTAVALPDGTLVAQAGEADGPRAAGGRPASVNRRGASPGRGNGWTPRG